VSSYLFFKQGDKSMTEEQALSYVQGASHALDLPLDAERAQRVAANLARSAVMARMLDKVPMAAHDELVEIYCPKPFPAL
jgi:hypothetical protein